MKVIPVAFAFAACLSFACSGGGDSPSDDPPGKGGSGGKGGSKGGSSGSKGGSGGSTSGGQAGSSGTDGGKAGSGGGAMAGSGGSEPVENGGSDGGGGEPPGDGLVAHWDFNEGSGTMIKDTSPNGNNGTLVAGLQDAMANPVAAPTWSDGKKGKAITLNGVDQWIRVPRSDSIDSTGTSASFSIAGWINFKEVRQATANSAFNMLLNRQEIGTSHEHFGLGVVEGKPTSAVHFFFATSNTPIELNKWVHLATTYDGITSKTYVDGVEVATLDIGWQIFADQTPVTIGGAQNLDVIKEFVSGQIDEVYLYSTALTPADVTALMNK